MPGTDTPRLNLPYLVVAQAQKELTHNEALTRIDALVHPVVQDNLSSPPTLTSTDEGKCWLVNAPPTGEWQNKTDQIAYWTGGSWRFVQPVAGMRIRNLASNTDCVWNGAQWTVAPTVADPQTGTVIDVEARAAIIALLSHFRMIGHIMG
jgi:Protein of unknown function (DUF2793)